MSAIDTAPGLAADVARIKRIEQLERDIAESNEYARKLGLKVTDLGNDIQKFRAERDALKARVNRLEEALVAELKNAELRYEQEQRDGDGISIASTRARFIALRDACGILQAKEPKP